MENIYYVEALAVEEKTETDLIKEYEIYKIKYEREITYEKFLETKKNWHEDKYYIEGFTSSYHETLEEAKEYVIENIGDINEAGSYEYAAVVEAPLSVSYYNSYQTKKSFILYKYNHDKNKYEEIPQTEEVCKYILEALSGLFNF